MTDKEDDFMNSTEFQKILENSIIENYNCNDINHELCKTVNNVIKNNDESDRESLKTYYNNFLRNDQNQAYNESLRIDKAKLQVAKFIQKIYRNNNLRKKAKLELEYLKYKSIQSKNSLIVKNQDDLSWKIELKKYQDKETIRLKRLHYYSNNRGINFKT